MLKPGDKVRYHPSYKSDAPSKRDEDHVYTVQCTRSDGQVFLEASDAGVHGKMCCCGGRHRWIAPEHKLEEVVKSSTVMNLLEKFSLVFKSEPERSFNKAGITDSNDVLTEEGSKVFLSWLLKEHGEDFKKEVVDPILAQKDEE